MAPGVDGAVADAEVPDGGAPAMHRDPMRCAGAEELPVRDAAGALSCVRVGVPALSGTALWPTPDGATAPLLYVNPTATAGGDGTMAAPFRTLPEALAAMGSAGTLMLARATFTVDDTVPLLRSVEIRGVGSQPAPGVPPASAPQGTVITTTAGDRPIFLVGATMGAPAGMRVVLANLALVYPNAFPPATAVAVNAVGNIALGLKGVGIFNASTGVHAAGATLVVQDSSVRAALVRGLFLDTGSRAVVTDSVIAEGGGEGVFSSGGHLLMRRTLVRGQGNRAVAIVGTADPTGGASDCAATDLTGEHGNVDCLDGVALQDNFTAGVYVDGLRHVRMLRSAVSGTLPSAREPGGDGVYVGAGGFLAIDPDWTMAEPAGMRTQIIGNGRGGVVVQGAGTNLVVAGATIASNAGPGVFAAQGAVLQTVAHNVVEDNGGFGIAAVGASVVEIQCNASRGARRVVLETMAGPFSTGDGLALFNATGAVMVVDNVLSFNDAYGARFSDTSGSFTMNTGALNRWGVGIFGSAAPVAGTNTVHGREPAPATTENLMAPLPPQIAPR